MGSNSTAAGSSQIGPTSSFFGSSSNQIQGALIAGVAATSHHESIKVWQKHHHYDEWEFLGIDMGIFGIQVGMSGVSSGPTGDGTTIHVAGFRRITTGKLWLLECHHDFWLREFFPELRLSLQLTSAYKLL